MADSRFILLPTPDPNEFAFAIAVKSTSLLTGNIPPTPGTTTYAEASKTQYLATNARVQQEWGDYVYTSMGKEGEYVLFYFGKDKTDEERAVPFRSSSQFGSFGPGWPPILFALKLVQDRGFPRTQPTYRNGNQALITSPRRYVREVYVPGTNEGTRFVEDEFLAPTPFVIPRHRTPVPQSVSYDFGGGTTGIFPECLHDDIEIDGQRSGERVIDSAGNLNSGSGSVPGQFFPATNFTRWRPYVASDKQEQVNGVWYRKRITVFPPPLPRSITQ